MTVETQSQAIKIEELIATPNIAEILDEETLKHIGIKVIRDLEMDLNSRSDWEQRTKEAMDLALQVVEQKTFPWPNASNVKFPLITIAALQYHARAYPALIPTSNIVKCKVNAEDKNGELAQRATRIEKHMSYQLIEEDEQWEDETDRVLITQPIIGCAFKKTYRHPVKDINVSENILAKDLVVPYFSKSLDTATRISHIQYFTKNDVYERMARGVYCEVELNGPRTVPYDKLDLAASNAQGVQPATQDEDRPYTIVEQHTYWDFDGDGYKEPYIITVEKETKKVLRIAPRYFLDSVEFGKDERVLSIKAEHYFTKYPFVPSPDGGFYDLGFGVLLGPLNNSINTIINQLIDSGTMSVTAGGFLGRGLKIKGGTSSFQPNEWKPVESTGDDLRKSIVPLPVREPSQVLFTLLSLLIDYGQRIGGSVDILVGENPGQNTPAETSRTMAEQGMKIFSGIFKRTYRSLRDEFRKHYRLNQLYLDKRTSFGDKWVMPSDYEGDVGDITPAADPNMVSDSQRIMQAQALLNDATAAPGLYNSYEVRKRYLEALRIPDIEAVLPDPKGPNAIPPQTPPKVQEAQVKAQAKLQEAQIKAQTAKEALQVKIAELMQDSDKARAEVEKLQAETLYLLEQADGVQNGHAIAMMEMQIAHAKQNQEGINSQINFLKMMQDQQNKEKELEMKGQQGE